MLTCVVLCSPLRADEHDSQFLAALRQRQLFDLAEKHARDRIAQRNLSAAEQGDLTVELIRTLALYALNSPLDERPQRWQAARDAASAFVAGSPANPRAILVRMQDALTLLAQGELGRQENDAEVLSPSGKEQALAALREGSSHLETLDKELAREIPLRRRTEPKAGELSADELFSLHQHVRQQLARALRNRALLYAAGSEDRLSLLLSASQVLEDLLRELPADDPLTPPAQLELGTSKRLLGEVDRARELFAGLNQEGNPVAIREQALAELVRLELSAGRRAKAADLLRDLPATLQSPDLALARLEMELDKLRRGGKGSDQAERRATEEAIEALARQITQNHGAYWGRRADQLVASALSSSGGAASTAILSRTADSLYLEGDFDQAIAAYEQAATQATEAAEPKAAFEFRYKAALVQQRRGQHSDAARRLRDLALGLRTHEQADQAHLLAAWNAAQAARADAAALTLYADILDEHASVWPRGDSLPQMQLWLGKLRETQRRWNESATAYSAVPRDCEHFPAALSGAAKVWKEVFREQQSQGNIDRQQFQAATAFLEAAAGLSVKPPQPLSESERLAALTAAELLLNFDQQEAAQAEAILQTALDRSLDAPAAWRAMANARLLVALASQPEKRTAARTLIAEASKAAPEQQLQMISSLTEVVREASADERRVVATLLLEAIGLLGQKRSTLDRAAQLQLDRVHADALMSAGREKEGLTLAARLARENPDHGEIQERHATLLLDSGDRESLQQGLEEWRKIAARSKPRTDRWLRAKYSVALAQFRLGDVKPAVTLLRYMLEKPPGLKGNEWQRPFEELLARCRQIEGGVK